MDYSRLAEQTISITEQAGEIIREKWGEDRNIRKKGRIDLVTDTDTLCEEFLKEKLGAVLPQADFLAEESAGGGSTDSHLRWIIDPLDGTTNFAHRIPMVAVSIGLWDDFGPGIGVVHLPLLKETFHAVRGGGAFLNQKPIYTTNTAEMEDALVATGFPYTIDKDIDEVLAPLGRVLTAARGVRRPGAAALDMAYLACGRYDAFYEIGLKPWDIAAGMLLVQEAGGRVSRFDGRPYTPGDWDILATNSRLHPAMSELLAPGTAEPKND